MWRGCLTYLQSNKKSQMPLQGLKFCCLTYGRDRVFLVAAKINVQDCLDINISEADMFSLLIEECCPALWSGGDILQFLFM